MLKVKLDFPLNMRLKINSEKVKSVAANKLAAQVRNRLEDEQGAAGPMPRRKATAIIGPQPEGTKGQRALNDTGQLLKSVKYRKDISQILPTGTRADGKRNVGIAFMQLAERPELAASDPFGVTDDEEATFNENAEKEIARQLESGEAGLVDGIKEILK